MTREPRRQAPCGSSAQMTDLLLPIFASGKLTAWRFIDFFAVTSRNPNTRDPYYRAECRFMD